MVSVLITNNFDLLVSAHNGLVINWQADSTNENKLWDIATAVGDANCQKITFHSIILYAFVPELLLLSSCSSKPALRSTFPFGFFSFMTGTLVFIGNKKQ